jgi:hypothetical protein
MARPHYVTHPLLRLLQIAKNLPNLLYLTFFFFFGKYKWGLFLLEPWHFLFINKPAEWENVQKD